MCVFESVFNYRYVAQRNQRLTYNVTKASADKTIGFNYRYHNE